MATRPPNASRFGEQLYESWEKAMGAWWDQVLRSPAFLGAMGEGLAARTQARATYERAMESTLDRMHLPTRKDIGRVARIATLLEERLLAQEDLLLATRDELLAAQREAVQARIDAAQARLELQEEVRRLREEVAALRSQAPPVTDPAPTTPATPARSRRARKDPS